MAQRFAGQALPPPPPLSLSLSLRPAYIVGVLSPLRPLPLLPSLSATFERIINHDDDGNNK